MPRVKYAMDYSSRNSFSMSYMLRKGIFPGVTEGIMTLAISQERASRIGLSGVDRNVTSYRVRAYASIFYVGIVLVGRRLNL